MLKSVRRKREANYASSEENSQATAARCVMEVDDHPISVVIDSGAAASIITKKLMKKLGYIIDQSSKLVIVAVNGEKTRALGEIMDFPLKVKGIHFTHNIQVIDSSDEILILRNDWLTKVNANLDWKE
jgi:predicted metal-dependent hydrolase